MRIRKTWPSSPSPIIPSPSHLPFSNTPSQQQPEVTRQLHPSEALVQRIRDLSYRFHQRFKQPPRNLHPEMKKAGEGNEEEEETKREDCIQPNPIQLDVSTPCFFSSFLFFFFYLSFIQCFIAAVLSHGHGSVGSRKREGRRQSQGEGRRQSQGESNKHRKWYHKHKKVKIK